MIALKNSEKKITFSFETPKTGLKYIMRERRYTTLRLLQCHESRDSTHLYPLKTQHLVFKGNFQKPVSISTVQLRNHKK